MSSSAFDEHDQRWRDNKNLGLLLRLTVSQYSRGRYSRGAHISISALTLTVNHRRAIAITHTHGKSQVQRPVGLKDRLETNRQTRAIALPFSLMRSVITNQH